MGWKKAFDGANLILGLWMIISPWVLGVSASAAFAWTAVILGLGIAGVSIWALVLPEVTGPEWVNVTLGALLFLSPWVLGYSAIAAAAWDAWIVGVIVVVLAGIGFPMLKTSGTGLNQMLRA